MGKRRERPEFRAVGKRGEGDVNLVLKSISISDVPKRACLVRRARGQSHPPAVTQCHPRSFMCHVLWREPQTITHIYVPKCSCAVGIIASTIALLVQAAID